MPRKKKLNGDEPATQHDLSLLSGQVTTRLDRMEGKIDKLETGQKKLESGQKKLEFGQQELKEDISDLKKSQGAILSVVQSIDAQLKEHKTHPARIRRLERSVFH